MIWGRCSGKERPSKTYPGMVFVHMIQEYTEFTNAFIMPPSSFKASSSRQGGSTFPSAI